MTTKPATRQDPILKSLLFVPGDSEKKMIRVQSSAASALILDLEDAVAIERIDIARGTVKEYLASRPDRSVQQLWVRINPLGTPMSLSLRTRTSCFAWGSMVIRLAIFGLDASR